MTSETIHDEQFGTLGWEPRLGWWVGTIELPSSSVAELNIDTPDGTDRAITRAARDAFTLIIGSEEKFRRKASDELLAIHNECWNDGEPIDAETFVRRLTVEAINLYPDGRAEIYLADDDMFWGHVIIVSMSEEGQFTNATIAG